MYPRATTLLLFPAAKPKSDDTKSSSAKEKKKAGHGKKKEGGKGSKGEGPPPESMQPPPGPLVALGRPKDNKATKRPRSVCSVVSCDIAVLGICSVYYCYIILLSSLMTVPYACGGEGEGWGREGGLVGSFYKVGHRQIDSRIGIDK